MIKQLDAQHIHSINSVLTAAMILEETIQKHAPNMKRDKAGVEAHTPDYEIHRAVSSAVSRILLLQKGYEFVAYED